MNLPIVSIIINCHNGEQFLKEAIQSILDQTFIDWELILFDNVSTDKTSNIFQHFEDNRFRYFRSTTFLTLMDARNQAINQANGQYIAFLDCDDLWLPNKLELQVKEFENENVGVVCCNYFKLNERDDKKIITQPYEKIPTGFVINEMLDDYFVHMSSLIFRKKTLDSLEYVFNPKYHIVGDLELLLRINITSELASIQVPQTYYRWHNNNSGYTAGFLFSNELDLLLEDVKIIPSIRNTKNFNKFCQKIYWLRILKYSYIGDKYKILINLKNVKNINLIKSIIILFAPSFFIKKIIDYKTKNS